MTSGIRIYAFVLSVVMAASVLTGCAGGQISDDDVARSEHHYRLARNYYNDNNLPMTRRELHEALDLNPDNTSALHLRGFILMGLRDLEGAAKALGKVLEIRPDFYDARNNLGTVMMAQGRYHDAIRIIEPLLKEPLYATPWFAHGNIGRSYYEIGNLKDARRSLEMAIFLNPRFCHGLNSLGLVFRDEGNARDALNSFKKAIEACPKYAEPLYHMGLLQLQANQVEAAKDSFKRCAELAPDTSIGKRCEVRR